MNKKTKNDWNYNYFNIEFCKRQLKICTEKHNPLPPKKPKNKNNTCKCLRVDYILCITNLGVSFKIN